METASPRRLGARAEDGDVGVSQRVSEAGNERRLWPDDDEIDREPPA